MNKKAFFESDKKPLLVLSLLCLILYFANIGGWDLWAPDEPKFGQITREMLQTNDWFIMHINREPYSDKPPLFFWLVGIFSILAGKVTSLTTRLPSALAGLGGVLTTYFIAKKLYNRKVAFLSGIILATTVKYFWQARWAQTDMLLCFFIFLSVLCFINLYKNLGNKQLNAYLMWVFMALATLSKGPVGLIIPLGSVITFLIANKEKHRIRELKIVTGFVLYAIILLIWLFPLFMSAKKSTITDLMWYQNITRYIKPERHNQPFYYFIERLPVDFMLWFFFVPSAFIVGFKSKNTPSYSNFKFNLCWFLFTFIFFSLSPGKRQQYIMPMYPALAMMAGYFFSLYIFNGIKFDKKLSIPLIVLIVVLILTTLGLKLIFNKIAEETKSTTTIIKPAIAALTLLLLALLVFFLLLKKSSKTIFYGITGISIAIMLVAVIFGFPAINSSKSTRELCKLIDKYRGDNEVVAIYKIMRAEYMFYGNFYLNEIEEGDKLREYFNTDESKLCIFRKRNYESFIEKNKDLQLYIFYDKQIGSREIVLAGNYCPVGDSLLQKLENDTNITNSQDKMEDDKEETD